MSQPVNSNQKPPKFELCFPLDSQKDYVQKELDQVQSIISRMATNSFQCKGWAIGIVTIVLAINKDTILLSGIQSLILLLPIFVFWYLDGFFLYTEQRYRDLFNDVVAKRFYKLEGETQSDWSKLFDFNYTRYEDVSVRNKSFWFSHIPMYVKNRLVRLGYWLLRNSKNAPPKISTIASVMFSKTLTPFYLLPTAFVLFTAFKGEILPEAKQLKEPVSIHLDSTTLQLLLKNAQTPLNIHVTMEKEHPQPEPPPAKGEKPKEGK
jgi:hypothetical protein